MNESSPYHATPGHDDNPYAMQQTPSGGPAPGEPAPDKAEVTPAVLAHLLAFCGYVFPFGHIIGPLIVYLIKKDDSAYVRHHAAESLNFQISMTIYMIIAAILIIVLIGVLFLLALIVVDLVLIIIGAIRASDGNWYRYPFSIRFID